jgi:hypothetical protein
MAYFNNIKDPRILDLKRNSKRVYYPGSGLDLETLTLILSDFEFIDDIIFCDYLMHLSSEVLSTIVEWEILKVLPLSPNDFNKNDWDDFYFEHKDARNSNRLNPINSNLFILHNTKTHKIVRFFQLATEGVGTYRVLNSSKLKPDLIILADHSLGGNWSSNIWGEPENQIDGTSYLKQLAKNNRFLLVDKVTKPWSNYECILTPKNNNRWNLYAKNRKLDNLKTFL